MQSFVDYEELKRSQEYLSYITSDSWKEKCSQRMKLDGFVCQCCGSRGTNKNPLQVHHFHYGNFKNEDIYKDLITLCKSCHESQHNLLRRITAADGSRMWDKSGKVPLIHVFSITGFDLNMLEESRNGGSA